MASHQHRDGHTNCARLMKHINSTEDIKCFEDFLSDAIKSECLCKAEEFIETIQTEKQKVGKSSDKSTALRLEGKELLSKAETADDLINVFTAYNESIAYAPNQSEELALSYGDRAKLLFLLKCYNQCLTDINRALCLNYPDQMMEELLVIKVRCMKIINHPDLLIIYNDCFKWIDKHSKDAKQSRATFKKAYKNKVEPYLPSKNIQFRDELLEEMQKLCPNLEKVEIKKSSHGSLITLVAAKDINVGEVIAVQKMWAQTLRMEKQCLACWQCLVVCFNPIPCHSCTVVMYCSESCKAEAWSKHHEYECQFSFEILHFMPNLAFAIRTCITAMKQLGGILPLMKEVLKMSKMKGVSKDDRIVDGKYPSESYRNVYFLKKEGTFTVCELVDKAIQASLFSHYVATGTTFLNEQYQGDWLTVMEERVPKFFASLLLRHDFLFLQLDKSVLHLPYDITIRTIDYCPLFFLVNHSCNPNSVKLTLKNHQVMVAINEIKKGQEINFSLIGSSLVEESKVERTRITDKILPFPCECEVCMMKKPLKVLPFWMLEKNKEKVKELNIMDNKIRDIISKHKSCSPKTAAEFLQQKAELFENLRPFFASAPPLCKEVVFFKNYLTKNLIMQLARKNHNF